MTTASAPPLRPPRAAALPRGERRAAIIASTLPLLVEHGTNVTTRQIAEAAGIAEGTIFRVFPHKDALIQAVVDTAFDPAPVEGALAAIDPALPFEQRLTAAVAIVQRRLADIWRLISSVGLGKATEGRTRPGPIDLEGLAALFEPERDHLRRDPAAAARVLRGLTLAVSHPALIHDHPMAPEEIVSLFLDGVRIRRPEPPPC